jgi:hypothetical protein
VSIVRIEIAQRAFESVDVLKLEFRPADGLHAFHDLDQPASRIRRFVAQEARLAPLSEHFVLRLNLAVANDEDFARWGNLAEQDVAADSTRAPCRKGQWLPLLDDLAHKEMFGNDEKVHDFQPLQIIIQQHKAWVVVRCKALAHGPECAVQHLSTEEALLAL